MMTDREQIIEAVARKLYAEWCKGFPDPDPPDWDAWQANGDLNGHGLLPKHFREKAEFVRVGIAKILCLENAIPECSKCTFETCRGIDFFDESHALLRS